MSYSPFDFVKEIQAGKRDLMADPQSEKDYVPFVVNKALSYELDCLMEANAMNSRHHLDKKLQFGYLRHIIRARKRPFHKWIKKETNENIACVKLLWECSERKALEILRVLTPEQLLEVKRVTDPGGVAKKHK
jgi:hypothetical protein